MTTNDDPDVRRDVPAPRAVDPLREALTHTAAHLVAAISLLERGGKAAKKAAPSDKMFDEMLKDYRAAVDNARAALAAAPQPAVDPLREALRACVNMLLDLVEESGRSVDYGEEDPFRMGEWFDHDDITAIDKARAALAAAPQPAPVDREALVEVIYRAGKVVDYTRAESIADALLAAGLRLPGAVQPAETLAWSVSRAARDVLVERRRQISVEGWTPEHDDGHRHDDLPRAAACYALSAAGYRGDDPAHLRFWPWLGRWWKPSTPRRDLVKAGALILAEIERLDRRVEDEA